MLYNVEIRLVTGENLETLFFNEEEYALFREKFDSYLKDPYHNKMFRVRNETQFHKFIWENGSDKSAMVHKREFYINLDSIATIEIISYTEEDTDVASSTITLK